jgi:exopolysaccharide biosynthesis polyprenyl glycosylphosphotransferase
MTSKIQLTSRRKIGIGVSENAELLDVRADRILSFTIKRIGDVLAASFILLIISPVLLLVALLIKLESPGPIFYKQERVGLRNQRFKMWKFRSMVANASALQKELEAQNEVKGGILFKIKDDPRITKVGKFIRRYSIDELPQLINVLLGEMSLVGPRPLPVRDIEKMNPNQYSRHDVLPGLTGLWQVKGRSHLDSDEIFYWDSQYIKEWSLGLDVSILLKTFKVVLNREGSY